MSDLEQWSFPEELQPDPERVGFDLQAALDAMVAVRTEIPEDAFTASILGTERAGNGVVIREDGLVLTIGYLVTEAQSVWLTTNRGEVLPAHVLAYDQTTGFGLLQSLGPIGVPALVRGSTVSASVGDNVYLLGQGGRAHALRARLIDKREFAGYWEYLLDEAVFTAPAHPQWGGAALVDEGGLLLGIGSLLVEQAIDDQTLQCNMAVPIDLLEPILDNILATGHSGTPPRPWLGMYATESDERLIVAGVAEGGPAAAAGIRKGDVVLKVGEAPVTSLAELFRSVWRLGPPGVAVPLTLSREGNPLRAELKSIDRNDMLKRPKLH